MSRTKRGFTLMELLIVVAIIAVLVAIAIPIISTSLKKSKLAACQANRRSLQSVLTVKLLDSQPQTDAQAQAIADAYLQSDAGKQYVCPSKGEITVVAGVDDKVQVFCSVHDTTVSFADNISGYWGQSMHLLTQAIADAQANPKVSLWTALRNLYLQAYNGTNPPLSKDEQGLLGGISDKTLGTLSWKPTLVANGSSYEVIMVASNATSPNNAYMIYYNGSYYYHDNGYGKQDSTYVTDQGGFDVSVLGAPNSRWIKTDG